jgi:hypothetical protein
MAEGGRSAQEAKRGLHAWRSAKALIVKQTSLVHAVSRATRCGFLVPEERPAVTGFGDNPSCAETAVLNHGIDIPSLRSRFQILSMQKTVLSAFVHRDLPPD